MHFDPQQTASPDFFVGQADKINKIFDLGNEAMDEKTKIAQIIGQRGIGKTSLAHFCKHKLQKELQGIGFHIYLGGDAGAKNDHDFFTKVIEQMVEESAFVQSKRLLQRILEFLSKYVKVTIPVSKLQIEVANISEHPEKPIPKDTIEFFNFICDFSNHIFANSNSGLIILILDDIESIAETPFFAQFLKELVDKNFTSNYQHSRLLVIPCCSLMSFTSIVNYNPSARRVINQIKIGKLNNKDVTHFFDRAFSKLSYNLDKEAMKNLVFFSCGCPRLMHILGQAVIYTSHKSPSKPSLLGTEDIFHSVIKASEIAGEEFGIKEELESFARDADNKYVLEKVIELEDDNFIRKDLVSYGQAPNVDSLIDRLLSLNTIEFDPKTSKYTFINRLIMLHIQHIFGDILNEEIEE